ncbi:TPA_asm: glycosyl transferase [Campylobacter jejuni]|nr:glycosyl transferase [Campylobacter jejuni]
MINFTFLKCIKLKFINEIFAEDCHFGVLLFIQAKNIYIYPNQIYIYRLRELSSMNFTKKKWIIHSNSYLKKIDVFRNSDTARFYYETISWIKIALEFIQFIKNDHVLNYGIKEQFLPVICNRALTLQNFKEDPLCLKIYIKDLELYIQNQPLGAISRVKEYLSYKIKKAIFEFRGIKILLLPFIIIKIILKHQKEVKNYKKNIDKNLLYKRPPLEFYKDYQDAIKLNLSKFKIKA